jgi:hypothetical protein
MADYDEIMRAFALISSIKTNIPDSYVVNKDWVIEYHNALDKVEKAIGKSLFEFKVPEKNIERSFHPSNLSTGEGTYSLCCDRSILLQKVDAVLTYLQLLLKPVDRKIGF